MPPPKARPGCGDQRRGAPLHGEPALQWWRPWAVAGPPASGPHARPTPRRPPRVGWAAGRGARARSQGALAAVAAGLGGDGTSRPQPVTRVDVPPPTGGVSTRGGPTVVDRCRQRAVRQGLQAPGEPPGSEASCGCRPGRNAQPAVKRAPSARKEGDTWGVGMGVETWGARVNHATVRREVSKRGHAGRVLPPSPRGLKAGARAHAARQGTVAGGPHGGPLSA
jgi:hypothetical protein